MKKKVLSIIIAGIMGVSLISCSNNAKNENSSTVSNKVEDNQDKEESSNKNKISKNEIIEKNNEIVERLIEFYKKNNIPYDSSNLYNTSAEITEISLSSAQVEVQQSDVKGIDAAEYNVLENFKISSYIRVNLDDNKQFNSEIITEYCEAIVGKKVDLNEIYSSIKNYIENNAEGEEIREEIQIDIYDLRIVVDSLEDVYVKIQSNVDVE